MRTRAYGIFGAVVLAALALIQFTGWSFEDVDEVKGVPKSIRDNPGSYRTSYGWSRPYFRGGK